VITQPTQFRLVCRARCRVGNAVATMVPSTELMKRAMETIANILQRYRAE